jgi:hypothetical protein
LQSSASRDVGRILWTGCRETDGTKCYGH